MPRVVPSDALSAFDRLHPGVASEVNLMPGGDAPLNKAIVRAIAELVADIPSELITLDPEHFSAFSAAVSVVRQALETQTPGRGPDAAAMLILPMFGGRSALKVIYDSLALCPDRAAKPATSGLEAVRDAALREDLRNDLSAAEGALMNHEYKAATVLAGSVVEAMLLWALDHLGMPEVQRRCSTIKLPIGPFERWTLDSLVAIAAQCTLIAPNTQLQSQLAKDYRNLIHPGRVARLQAKCTKGTAHGALAAVELVASDLLAQFGPAP